MQILDLNSVEDRIKQAMLITNGIYPIYLQVDLDVQEMLDSDYSRIKINMAIVFGAFFAILALLITTLSIIFYQLFR